MGKGTVKLIKVITSFFETSYDDRRLIKKQRKEGGNMKKILVGLIMLILFLVGCGQGSNLERTTGYEGNESSFEVKIPVTSEEDAVRVIRDFISSELEEAAYSGLYLDHDPNTHLVVLIQEQYFNHDLLNKLKTFAKKTSTNNSRELLIKLKPAKHSYQVLETIMNKLNASYEDILVTNRRVLSFGINEMENRIDLYVSTKADLNEEFLNEITGGNDDILNITEGLLGNIDDDGVPTADPYIEGTIMDYDKEQRRFLVEDQIYFTIDDGTIFKDLHGNTMNEIDLQEGDEVVVWTDGPILESFPAQGYAVVIQKIN